LLVQICDAEDVRIRKGVVSRDHVHMHIEYPPKIALSDLLKRLKGRSSRLIRQEFPHLQKRYWGRHFWATGYGAWSTGNNTEEAVQEYLEHYRQPSNKDNNPFILEDDWVWTFSPFSNLCTSSAESFSFSTAQSLIALKMRLKKLDD